MSEASDLSNLSERMLLLSTPNVVRLREERFDTFDTFDKRPNPERAGTMARDHGGADPGPRAAARRGQLIVRLYTRA